MAKIIVVDDDSGLRSALKEILSTEGHAVIEAENGVRARDLILSELPELIISDFQMPVMDGLELLRWTKANTRTPFILMTAFSNILETKRAFDEGADDFFAKPFKNDDILRSVKRWLSKDHKVSSPDSDDEFCRIPIEDFVSGAEVRINIYIRLSRQKYVRIAHKGDSVAPEQVAGYRTKGVEYLYAPKEEFAVLVGFNLKIAKTLKGATSMSADKRLRFLRYTTETVLENLIVNGIDRASFENAKECMCTYLQVASESPTVVAMLESLNSHADWLYAHSLGVGVYSVMIGTQLGWRSCSTHFKLGMSGLLHDIGLKEVDVEIIDKRRPEFTQQERHLFETHPTRSRDILDAVKEMPGDITHIVWDHHETLVGQGYPRRISGKSIHPLAKIVSVADAFCYRVLNGPNSCNETARQATEFLRSHYLKEFDEKALDALSALCA